METSTGPEVTKENFTKDVACDATLKRIVCYLPPSLIVSVTFQGYPELPLIFILNHCVPPNPQRKCYAGRAPKVIKKDFTEDMAFDATLVPPRTRHIVQSYFLDNKITILSPLTGLSECLGAPIDYHCELIKT